MDRRRIAIKNYLYTEIDFYLFILSVIIINNIFMRVLIW